MCNENVNSFDCVHLYKPWNSEVTVDLSSLTGNECWPTELICIANYERGSLKHPKSGVDWIFEKSRLSISYRIHEYNTHAIKYSFLKSCLYYLHKVSKCNSSQNETLGMELIQKKPCQYTHAFENRHRLEVFFCRIHLKYKSSY